MMDEMTLALMISLPCACTSSEVEEFSSEVRLAADEEADAPPSLGVEVPEDMGVDEDAAWLTRKAILRAWPLGKLWSGACSVQKRPEVCPRILEWIS